MYAPQGYIGALVNLGRKTEAKEAFRSVEPYLSSFKKGISYGYLNSMDRAFLYVNKAISEKDIYCAFMKIDQSWDIFRSDPRYQELEARMNFPKIEKILN